MQTHPLHVNHMFIAGQSRVMAHEMNVAYLKASTQHMLPITKTYNRYSDIRAVVESFDNL